VIIVDLGLDLVADRQKLAVAGGEVPDQAREPAPERIGRNPRPVQGFPLDEVVKDRCDLEAVRLDARHRSRFHGWTIMGFSLRRPAEK
jgi:hypothetical protein